ncbi:hypothetical protein GW17_00056031 [Ensete ventricosum]|nr:hypothetical protein GW17_00056031 [Ensete ventricosum]
MADYGARRVDRLQGARKGLPPAASPTASRGDGAGRMGGCPLAGQLPTSKDRCRLHRGSGSGARSFAGSWQQPLRPGRGRLPPLAGAKLQLTTLEWLPVRFGHGWAPPLASWPWPQPTAPLQGALAMGRSLIGGQALADRPCRGPSLGQQPLHVDIIQVAAPCPQAAPTVTTNHYNKCVEQFYALQSHHT